MAELIHELIAESADRRPLAEALVDGELRLTYRELADRVEEAAHGFAALGLARFDRIAIFIEKRHEAVVAMFAAAAAGCVFVPVNPLLKPAQVAHVLRDSNACVLVTTSARLDMLVGVAGDCPELRHVLVTDAKAPHIAGLAVTEWREFLARGRGAALHRTIETDMAALLYTSGSSGPPKGVVLSHRNVVAGACSVARYLGNSPADRILAILPLSFDYGMSQLTTAFASGAAVVLMNQVLTRDIPAMIDRERITGLAAVPTLWIQLANLDWRGRHRLRYITSSGGCMPRPTLATLRQALPRTRIYLMYGLTEAFRSTYLAPEQVDARPDSIGKAIPNAEVLVLDPEGRPCGPGEPGELVHRGPLVSLGYWSDPEQTAQRFRPLPPCAGQPRPGAVVWSGDTVRMDEEGYLYFICRTDEMIKTSGYRISPTEIEDVLYATGMVGEAVALGVAHPVLGQAIAVVATPGDSGVPDSAALLAACKARLPSYMLPALVELRPGPLPRNPNGKFDRRMLASELAHLFAELVP
ncbi:acyl-CoA ligase (AMP-forming), exosortase A system-associated [Massilia sp. RP-1-19]|uniref:Acyl-CoA ligase (AMP-forming), exosortase A system-associated n=1 Tax=Massilia polaris TaxID=2728846 RepID=A0A848HJ79_9BURK|nr:acyl-CoA ligase (AMP-forming), exosortase A system-associated [Massilia polaris]NML60189.1 acyl-CoA ligase (AMP-forming), exosortase A system-associated [Massilia polaris]